VTVSVSTGGRSPALSKYLRERIESEIAGAGAMAELTSELRADLKAENVPPTERRDAIRSVVRSSHIWKALRSGDSNPRLEAERVIGNNRGGEQ
jgi:precorrin-2 dehydrogenase/sirohydrochlorin ferrochelatase